MVPLFLEVVDQYSWAHAAGGALLGAIFLLVAMTAPGRLMRVPLSSWIWCAGFWACFWEVLEHGPLYGAGWGDPTFFNTLVDVLIGVVAAVTVWILYTRYWRHVHPDVQEAFDPTEPAQPRDELQAARTSEAERGAVLPLPRQVK